MAVVAPKTLLSRWAALCIAVVIIAFGGLNVTTVLLARQAQWWVSHTQTVIAEARALLGSMVDAETGERGYLISGDEIYLQPYNTALSNVPRHIGRLKELTSDNPSQQRLLTQLDDVSKVEFAAIARSIDAHRQGGGRSIDKSEMDRFRLIAKSFEDEEAAVFTGRAAALDRSYDYIIGGVLSFALFTALLVKFGVTKYQQVEARATMAALEQQLRHTIESSPAAIAMFDRNLHYLAASQRYADDYGIDFEDLIGRGHDEVFPESADKWREIHRRCLDGAVEKCAEDPFIRANKPDEWVRWELRPWHKGNREIGGVVFFSEMITARKIAEAALLEKTAMLAQSNTELEQFAYVASHDLQSPLRNIVSYAQLLTHRYKGKIDADADDFIGFIVDNGKRMTGLINDLLEYSRITGRSAELAPISANEAVALALANLAQDLDKVGADITIGDLPQVIAERSLLVSVFQNLLGNSLKYRAPDRPSQLSVTAERIGPDRWRFAVADNGIGIETQYFDKIFEVFQRLNPKGEVEGTGIGLTLCRRIVHRFGGIIWVESTPGCGTTVFFTLRDGSAAA